jgi:TetR/AcrR family transcriptional regulator
MENRELILRNALNLFALRGYDAVGVQEVAESAGITKPTLYHYFGSKQGLLRALIETYHDPFTRQVREAVRYTGDLPGSLAALARVFFDFARQNPTYARLQLALMFAPQESDAWRLAASRYEEQHALVEGLFSEAERDHGNMRGRAKLYASTWIGMLNTCITLWLNDYQALDDALLQRVVGQFQYGIYS